MVYARIFFCLVGVSGCLQAMEAGKQVIVRSTWFGTTSEVVGGAAAGIVSVATRAGAVATSTPSGRITTGACIGAGAVTGVYALCKWLMSPTMVDAEVQTDGGARSKQVAALLDDIVAKVNEFAPQRCIVANLREVRKNIKLCKPGIPVEGSLENFKKTEKELIKQKNAHDLCESPSFKALKSGLLPRSIMPDFTLHAACLNEVLQSCSNDQELCAKFGALARVPSADGKGFLFPETIEEHCQAFAAYVETIKKDLANS